MCRVSLQTLNIKDAYADDRFDKTVSNTINTRACGYDNAFGCVYLSVCSVIPPAFESFDLEGSFYTQVFRISFSYSVVKIKYCSNFGTPGLMF